MTWKMAFKTRIFFLFEECWSRTELSHLKLAHLRATISSSRHSGVDKCITAIFSLRFSGLGMIAVAIYLDSAMIFINAIKNYCCSRLIDTYTFYLVYANTLNLFYEWYRFHHKLSQCQFDDVQTISIIYFEVRLVYNNQIDNNSFEIMVQNSEL